MTRQAPAGGLEPKTEIRVSVVLVTYNHERYIRQALESVLGQQTPFEFEVLVSEDCSTDATRSILLEYQRCHPNRIRLLLSERNLCTNEVTSRAIAAARREYIALLDGDDWWSAPDKLQRQVEFLDRHPQCALSFHDVDVVYEDGKTVRHRYVPPGTPTFTGFDDILVRCYIPGCSPLFRWTAIGRLPSWYNTAPVGDWPLYVLAAEQGQLGYLDAPLGVYRRHSGGQWSGRSRRQHWKWNVELFDLLIAHLSAHRRPALRRARARCHETLARELAAEGERRAAMRALVRALADEPAPRSAAARERLRLLLHLATGARWAGRGQRAFVEERAHLQARWLIDSDRPEGAIPLLRAALAELPDSVLLKDDLAGLLAAAGEVQAAAALLEAAIAQRPDDARLHYHLSRVLEGVQAARALAAARAACRLDPNCHFLHSHLGALLMQTDELDESEAALARAVALAPDDAHGQFRLSQLLQRRGRAVDALAAARRAAELHPAQAYMWGHLGGLLAEADQLEEAEAALGRAIELAPDDPLSHYRLGQLLHRRGAATEALDKFRRATELDSSQAWLWSHLGEVLTEAGELDEADAALQRAVALAPDHALSRYRMGQLRHRRGRLHDALETFRRAAELDPTQAWLWSHLGEVLTEAGELDEAEAALQRALELAPEHALSYFRLGQLLERRGNAAEALSAMRCAVELDPGQSSTWSHLGAMLTEAGPLDEAEAALRRALERAPHDALSHFRLAGLLRRQGRLEEALVAARRAVEIDAANEHFQDCLASVLSKVDRRLRAAQAGSARAKDYCILLAAPRTGTTVLELAVAKAFVAEPLGEIFDRQHEDPPETERDVDRRANFFSFRHKLLKDDQFLMFPSYTNQSTIFDQYLQMIDGLTDKDKFIIDVKYNSWHHLNEDFLYPTECPTLLKIVKEKSLPVVHIVRNNLFALYCSMALALKREVWHAVANEPPAADGAHFIIDIAECEYIMNLIKSSMESFENWFHGCQSYYRLAYEDMFIGDAFSERVTEIFSDVFEEPPRRPLAASYRKITPPLGQVVQNADDVLRHFDRTPFAEMVSQALARLQ